MFREVMLDSSVHAPAEGTVIFEKNDYTNTFYTVLDGEVQIEVAPGLTIASGQGNFFGEMSLLSGRRRSATVRAGKGCVLIETPRRTMNKLLNSVDAARRVLDETFILRTIQSRFAPGVPLDVLRPIAAAAQLNQYKAGELIFAEGDEADTLHLIRSGSVTIAKNFGEREIPMAYVAAGNYVGEMGLLGNSTRSASVRATVKTETVSLDAEAFNALLDATPALRAEMEQAVRTRSQQNVRMQGNDGSGDVLSFLMQHSEQPCAAPRQSLCVNCDNCEVAVETRRHLATESKGGAVFAEFTSPPPAATARPPLHEGLPARCDPAGSGRRGVYWGQLHWLRQLRGIAPTA